MIPAPTRIEPVFMKRIWGSRSLAPLYPEKTDLLEPLGEVWLTSVDCLVASGPYQGKFLGAAWREMPVAWRGTSLAKVPEFPILVKFIFPADKLSIQVHPDDAYASANEKAAGGRGKTEMWHAVAAQKDAYVLIGLKPKVSREQFLKAVEDHTVEELFESHPVSAGDTFFIPAGTPHAIGPNMILCEVQEYSDLTYRVYDYGRTDAHGNPRELHIEKALQVTDFAKSAAGGRVSPAATGGHPENQSNRVLAACHFFSAERQDFRERIETRSNPFRFEVIVVLSGSGTLAWQDQQSPYNAGECWFIPASLGNFSVSPKSATSIIRSTVPNMETVRGELQKKGMSAQEINKVLFK